MSVFTNMIVKNLDDMPAHIRSLLTSTSVSIPIENSKSFGTWQAIYLYEHRNQGYNRKYLPTDDR